MIPSWIHGSSPPPPPPPPNLGGEKKISDQNNEGRGAEQKIKFVREINLRGDLTF